MPPCFVFYLVTFYDVHCSVVQLTALALPEALCVSECFILQVG
jgi:hypothetical protein